jgi:hypothetical protein
MPDPVSIIRLAPRHLLTLQRQPSQRVQMGVIANFTADEAATVADQPEAWVAIEGDGRIAACFGIVEQFAGRQGVAWAIFAEGLHAAHLKITRFARAQLAGCGLRRIEAVAIAPRDAATLAEMVAAPTPEMRWARRIGMRPVHVLHEYGAASETLVLFERLASWTR